ncbi:DUF4012 domain-containing protein, partial [Patescibacteria group bacterium]|nr:DUF4012 domain-containing protein [Patescibacteria group bacterium]
ILKCLYSLSAYGKKTAIISNPISAERILSVLKSAYPENGFSFVNGAKKTTQADVDETEFVDEDGVGLIKNKVEIIWERMGGKKDLDGDTLVFPKIPLNTCRADKESVFLKAVDKKGKYLKVPLLPFRSLKKWRAKIVTIFLLVFLLPALMLMASVVFFLLGKRAFMAGNVKVAKPIFNTILVIANVTARYSDCLSEIPMAGIIYQQVEDSAEILKKTSEIGLGGIDIVNNLLNLSESVVQKGDYDLTNQSRKIFFGLELLYKQLGFLQAEMRYLEFLPEKIAGVILGDIDVVSVREKVLYIQKLAEELPALLGENKKVSYMILFQNNTILRSTGGSIETFGLVSFDDGKFEGLEIFDSSQVDRNLQGAVDPPSPIKKYFNETKWYLRDSNRSSDFPTSAAKAEWFLDKGMGRAVDGVIALDLEFIKLILDKVGGINLENTNVMMDKDNVYEIVGSFSQDDNYPKLDKESSYTNFVRAVFAKSANLGDLGKVKFLQSVLNSLNQKNIQLFSHGKNTQRALAELNWDGAVRRAVCQNNCYSDFIGLTEVNVGGGNSNLIAGELELSVSLEEGLIKRKLIVFLENPTDDFYKAYFQVLTNADSGFGQVETVGTEFKESLTPEVYAAKGYKEAGVLVEILPKETKAIIFNWESGSELNFSEEGEYALFWRKQAGAVARLIDINIYVPESVEIKDSQDFGLTNEGSYGYNTKLLKDFSTNILW